MATVQERIGVRFDDAAVLRTALTHSSYANEHPDEAGDTNERLEFLGDAVLGLVVAETLYEQFPAEGEGRLTEWRARLVMGPTLARVAQRLDLGRSLRLGRGEASTGGRERERNLERVYEALVGAVMLDRGLEEARGFIRRSLAEEFGELGEEEALVNPKGALQQFTSAAGERPDYLTVDERGPEHAREFTVEVRIDGRAVGRGQGATKQLAEKAAAREALAALRPAAAGVADPAAPGAER